MSLVFVYGTLKKGHGNHHLLNGAEFLGEAVTIKHYAMVNAGFPVLLEATKYHRPIAGELYRVPPATVDRLDGLEREGEMYNRVAGKVVYSGGTVIAEYYVGVPEFWHPRQLDRLKGFTQYATPENRLEWRRL